MPCQGIGGGSFCCLKRRNRLSRNSVKTDTNSTMEEITSEQALSTTTPLVLLFNASTDTNHSSTKEGTAENGQINLITQTPQISLIFKAFNINTQYNKHISSNYLISQTFT